jgi:hypothetical protein
MWSKLSTLALTAVFLLAVCSSVAPHEGPGRDILEAGDEQPWGGEHYNDPVDDPLEVHSDPNLSTGEIHFIRLTLNYGWFTFRQIIADIFELKAKSGETGESHMIDQTSGETNNQDQTVGTR